MNSEHNNIVGDFLATLPKRTAVVRAAEVAAKHPGAIVPEEALRVYRFADQLGLLVFPNKNRKEKFPEGERATSRSAATTRRPRIAAAAGAEGIPLYDEMTTRLLVVTINGQDVFVLANYRSHRMLDEEALTRAVGGTACRSAEAEELEQFGLQHGTVTPFLDAHRDHFEASVQSTEFMYIMDDELFSEPTQLGTVMTNATHPGWSVEFRPQDLLEALQRTGRRVLQCDIVVPTDPNRVLQEVQRALKTTLLIVGGDGPETARYFVDQLRAIFHEALSSLRVPAKDDHEVPLIAAGDASQPTIVTVTSGVEAHSMALSDTITIVARHDADTISRQVRAARHDVLITVPGHCRDATMQPLYKNICSALGTPERPVNYLSIMESTMRHLGSAIERLHAKRDSVAPIRVLVLAGDHTLDQTWSGYPQGLATLKEQLEGNSIPVEYVYPTPAERQELDDAMFNIKDGKCGEGIGKMNHVLIDKYGKDTDMIVTMSTEFSVVNVPAQKKFRRMNTERQQSGSHPIVFVDGLGAYAHDSVQALLPSAGNTITAAAAQRQDCIVQETNAVAS